MSFGQLSLCDIRGTKHYVEPNKQYSIRECSSVEKYKCFRRHPLFYSTFATTCMNQ